MTQQTTPVADDAAQLTALVAQVSALPAPDRAADVITDAINFLFENGAADQQVVLDDIYSSASALVTAVQQTTQAFTATMSIAQTLRKQREEARQALETLKHAVETADTSVPEIDELWDSISELINEENMEYIWDVADDYVRESISEATPLKPMRAAVCRAERILNGSKTALLIPALSIDRYRLQAGEPWRRCGAGFMHNLRVQAIHHVGLGYATIEGDVIPVRSVETREVIRVQISDLRMVACDRLGDTDLRDLGYSPEQAYDAEVIFYLRRIPQAWWIRFIPLLAAPRAVP